MEIASFFRELGLEIGDRKKSVPFFDLFFPSDFRNVEITRRPENSLCVERDFRGCSSYHSNKKSSQAFLSSGCPDFSNTDSQET